MIPPLFHLSEIRITVKLLKIRTHEKITELDNAPKRCRQMANSVDPDQTANLRTV